MSRFSGSWGLCSAAEAPTWKGHRLVKVSYLIHVQREGEPTTACGIDVNRYGSYGHLFFRPDCPDCIRVIVLEESRADRV